MQNIANFFKKFKNIRPTSGVVKVVVLDVLKKMNIPILGDEIVYSGGVVYIKSSQIIKSEIFINKKSILDEIENKLNKRIVVDIR